MDDVDHPGVGVDDDIEDFLGVVPSTVEPVYLVDLVDSGLDEDVVGLGVLPHIHQRLVQIPGPVEIGGNQILILVH